MRTKCVYRERCTCDDCGRLCSPTRRPLTDFRNPPGFLDKMVPEDLLAKYDLCRSCRENAIARIIEHNKAAQEKT